LRKTEIQKMPKIENKFTQWLEKLQQESWQLELLISGFLLTLLFEARIFIDGSLTKNADLMYIGEGTFVNLLLFVLYCTCIILIINLVCHVILRSLWIGAIGLRNVSGDINLDNIKMSPVFKEYLERKIPSFDDFIENLENFCCLIFAFTFLIIFAIFSFCFGIMLLIVFSIIIVEITSSLPWLKKGIKYLMRVFIFVYSLTGFIYMVDFLTLGWIKKIEWFSKIYRPIHRFFSVISFSRIYRPLYYNMVDNPLGRKVMLAIIPYLGILTAYSLLSFNSYAIFPSKDSVYKSDITNYDNLSTIENRSIINIQLSKKYYDNDDFLEVFYPFALLNKIKYKACYQSYSNEKVGVILGSEFTTGFKSTYEKEKPNLDSIANIQKKADFMQIACVSSHFEIGISDSVQQKVSYEFYQHPKTTQKGILATVDILSLARGKYFLDFKVKDSTDRVVQRYSVPFWKK
jgi:hypothetical protein